MVTVLLLELLVDELVVVVELDVLLVVDSVLDVL
jgi:hypothetical protein